MRKSLGVIAAGVLIGITVFADPVVELKMPADVYRPVEFVVWAKAENPQPGITYESVRFRIIVAHEEPFPDGTEREDVFTVIEVDGSTNTQGINETFQLSEGKFVGYWGPSTGFPMPSNYSVTTKFTVKMATSAPLGEYTLTVDLLNLSTNPPQILATARASLLLSADKLVVGPGNPWEYQFDTIQEAIDAADPEHTIIVSSGLYKESVTINKSLILRGGSSPTLQGTGMGIGVTIQTGSVTLQGFVIQEYSTGVEVNVTSGTGEVVIQGNVIQNNRTGIHIQSGTGVQIIGNTISGNTADTGILVESASENEAHGNKIYGNDIGVKNEDQNAAFEAGCNWWGDPTGPEHKQHNPNGKGDKVEGNVTFGEDNREWWTSENGPCAYHYFLTMEAPYPQNGGTVQPSVGGPYPYAAGTGAEVIATANPGFGFVEWQELVNGQWVSINGQATHTITMDGDRRIRALFLPAWYSLSVTVQPPSGGTVMVSPNPGADGKYAAGTTVTLTVTPAAGFQFVRWAGPNASDVQGNQIVMNSDKSITAVFDRIPIFSEDFEDIRDWTRTGLWHTCSDTCFQQCEKLTGVYAHYAKPGTCSYDTGARTMGILTSPVIEIPANTTLTIQFDFARHVESYTRAIRDHTYVQIRLGYVRVVRGRESLVWTSWRTIWARSSRDRSPECGTATYNFGSGRYTRLQIRFVFDSVNRYNNNYPGWAIDNLVVKPAGGLQPGALEVADIGLGWEEPAETETITVVNTPNPVRDVHTTTFTVLGVEAEAVRVEVYDLTGRLVWKAEAPGNELVWHTEDLTGLPLANGVYLYIAYVKVDGEWIRLEPQKLVILR